jgi:hypothetical protein
MEIAGTPEFQAWKKFVAEDESGQYSWGWDAKQSAGTLIPGYGQVVSGFKMYQKGGPPSAANKVDIARGKVALKAAIAAVEKAAASPGATTRPSK